MPALYLIYTTNWKYCSSIDDFTFEIIKRADNPIETTLAEAQFMLKFNASMNRRHEMVGVARTVSAF